MIEFEREWQGGSQLFCVSINDIVSFERHDANRTLFFIRDRGEIIGLVEYSKVKKTIWLMRSHKSLATRPT
jgi:hypothetical protein